MKNNNMFEYCKLLKYQKDILDLSPFEEAFPGVFSFLSFLRVYKNGYSSIIATNAEPIAHFFRNFKSVLQVQSLSEEFLKKKTASHTYLFQAYDHLKNFELFANQQLHLSNIFGYIHVTEDYYDNFILCAPPENTGVLNIYLNENEKIKSLCHTLAARSEQFFKKLDKNEVLTFLGEANAKIATDFLDQVSTVTQIKLPHEQLTPRQLECLYLILQGFSAKMIAQKFNLSPRTVETHIEAIKDKLGFFRKSELIGYAQKYMKL